MLFINKLDYSRDWTIFIILISSFGIMNVPVPDLNNIFLWVATSVADAVAVNLNDIKTFLAYDLSTFLIKGNQVFSDGPNNPHENLHDNPPDFPMQSSSW